VSEIHEDPSQPRHWFEEGALARLAETIKTFGILSPIVVTPRNEGGYTIVLGERRFRAAKLTGLTDVPTITTSALAEKERLELQLLENLGREDLNVIEEGRAYLRLLELGASQKDVAQKVGRSEASVSRALAIAQNLPQEWLDQAEQNRELQSPSKLYEIAQASESSRKDLWATLLLGATRNALRGPQVKVRKTFDAYLKKEALLLLKGLRTRLGKQGDKRRLTYRSLADHAVRKLLDSWDHETEEGFLKALR
jgi:ParB/RepB/Spo0J family partition protein